MKAEQMVEENQFFREATLKICGSLEIEKAPCLSSFLLRPVRSLPKVSINPGRAFNVIQMIGSVETRGRVHCPFFHIENYSNFGTPHSPDR
jgi:hypothetical protein